MVAAPECRLTTFARLVRALYMRSQHPTYSGQTANASDGAKQELSTIWRHQTASGFPDALLDLIAGRFRLLGDPLRLKLLAALTEGEMRVGDLVALTHAGQANVSKHLAILADGGLVARRKAGTSTWYSISDPATYTLCDVVCTGILERAAAQVRALGLTDAASAGGQLETSAYHPTVLSSGEQ